MGQKPRVCSSYFFEMEDGSRIEVRREPVPGSRSGGSCSCPGCREEIMTDTKKSKYRKWGKRRRHQVGSRKQKEVNRAKGS